MGNSKNDRFDLTTQPCPISNPSKDRSNACIMVRNVLVNVFTVEK